MVGSQTLASRATRYLRAGTSTFGHVTSSISR
jgi:hypothetical protein